MATTAGNLVIIDTNILLYLYIDNEEAKKAAIAKIKWLKGAGHELVVSEQIIREFIVALTNIQKITKKVDFNKLKEGLQFILHNFSIVWPSFTSVITLEELVIKYSMQGKKIHDANIIAVAKTNNISKILTNNAADFACALKEGFEIITTQ